MISPQITEILMRSLATATFVELPKDRALLTPQARHRPADDAPRARRPAVAAERPGLKGWLLTLASSRLRRA